MGCLTEIPQSLSHILTPIMPHLWFLNFGSFKVRPKLQRHAKSSESRILLDVYSFSQSFTIISPTPNLTEIFVVTLLFKAFQSIQGSFQRYCNSPWGLILHCFTHYLVTGTSMIGTDIAEIKHSWLWVSTRCKSTNRSDGGEPKAVIFPP